MPLSELNEDIRNALKIFENNGVPVLSMSTVTDEGVMEVKNTVSIFYIHG